MGLLIRSSASGVNEDVLLEDFRFLKQQWYFIQKLALFKTFPCLLYKDEDLVKKIIQNFYQDSMNSIIVDSEDALKQVQYYLSKWCYQSFANNQIKLQVCSHSESILEKFNINTTIRDALKPKVKLALGGYLFIETYEALTVIDVNSGSFNKTDNSKEAVLRTNCYAATEIAYQLRVRNINGVIIVDFIDMNSHRDQLQLLEHFNRVLGIDNAKPQIIQLSKLGLVELTRRRRGQSLFELFNTTCDAYDINNSWPVQNINRRKNSLIYKSVNALFFNTVFTKALPVKKCISCRPYNRIKRSEEFYYVPLKYTYRIPLVVYSDIIDARC